jgi:hypothetical protein
MHRSGTSMLAGTLRAAGVYFGEVLDRPFALNPTGLQEPAAILRMHEDLLEKNGGSWHSPPSEVTWHKLHEAVRDLYIESRSGRPLWAFKDPRTILVLDGWVSRLKSLEFIGIFRHPAEVAMSMHKRNEHPIEHGLKAWTAYNQRLLDLHMRKPFPLLEFVGDGQTMNRACVRGLRQLGLGANSDALAVYGEDKKHIDTPDIDLPQPVAELYQALQARKV